MADTIVVVTEVPVTIEVAGPQGPQGAAGAAGQGIATGGTTGQVLKKKSGTDYDTEWGTGGGTVTYGTTAGTATQGNDGRISGLTNGGLTTGATLEVNNVAGISVPDFNFYINAEDNQISSSNTLFFDRGINTQGVSTTSLLASGQTTITGSTTLANSINLRNPEDTGVIEANFIKAQEFDVDSGGSLNFLSGSGTGIVASTTTAFKTVTLPNATGTVALTQQATDYEVTDATKGVIMKSPNNSRWRITIDDNGVLLRTALAVLFSLSFMCGAKAQVRDLVYNTNNVVVGPTNTNSLAFTNSVAFSNPLTFGTNAAATRTNLGLGSLATNNSVPSAAATTNSLLTADGSGGSSFVASRVSVSGLTTNVVRTSWANSGADKPTNDTGLSLTYAAGTVYKLRWSAFVSSTWSNVAYGLAFSSTNSFALRNGYQVTPQSSTPSGATIATGVTNTTLVSDSTSSYPAPVYVGGEIVFFSTNAGTLNFRFWTTASNTNTSTLFSNSIISLEKIYP